MQNLKLLSFLTLILFALPALAIDPIYTSRNKAVKGYDTVAYFTEGMPVKGSKEFSYEYKGAQWYFSNADNLATFKADPEKYAPQFGGYCAYAVANNTTASIRPELWTIVDGKLYLNYSKGVQKRWNKDRAGYIAEAHANWKGILCAKGKNSDEPLCE